VRQNIYSPPADRKNNKILENKTIPYFIALQATFKKQPQSKRLI